MIMADENPNPSEFGTSHESTASPAPAPRSYSRQKRRRNMLIAIGVLVVLVVGIFLWRYFSSYESTDDAQVDVHLYPVSARISGYVIRVNVDDNQWVQKGTVLAEIDPRDYEIAVAQAQANLEQAEAEDVKAQEDLRRYKLLVDKKEVAEQVYDQALATAKGSTAAVTGAQA